MTAALILGVSAGQDRLQFHPFERPSEFPDRSIAWVAALDPAMHRPFLDAAPRLIAEMPRGLRALTVLVPRLAPPTHGARHDGMASSFVCSAGLFRSLLRGQPPSPPAPLTFALLYAIMNGRLSARRVAVRQLPLKEESPSPAGKPLPVSLIMAHRGTVRHLDRALDYIAKAAQAKMKVRVGLDLDAIDRYGRLMARFPDVQFFRISQAPAGPYVIRQLLVDHGREPLIAFHDSDDISCFDRFTALTREMSATGCDLIGCHELRFHELDREVTILRFPVDASSSLRAAPNHVMLHPSSMIGRAAFHAAGGFSTDRKIANDTQFLLRACFNIRIRNIDGFYYIRRKHPAALTVAPETCLDHPVRAELLRVWHRDFTEIKHGRMALADSSLRAIPSERDHRLIRVPRR